MKAACYKRVCARESNTLPKECWWFDEPIPLLLNAHTVNKHLILASEMTPPFSGFYPYVILDKIMAACHWPTVVNAKSTKPWWALASTCPTLRNNEPPNQSLLDPKDGQCVVSDASPWSLYLLGLAGIIPPGNQISLPPTRHSSSKAGR